MPTVAEIAKLAVDGVQGAIPDAIDNATLTEKAKGTTYDTVTASYPVVSTDHGTCRAVLETQKPISDVFPDYIVGSSDQLYFLEGYSSVPKEGWEITIDNVTRTIKRAQDILNAGSIGYVIAS